MHILLFFILIALIFPGLMRFILSLVGLAIVCVVIMTAAHAGSMAFGRVHPGYGGDIARVGSCTGILAPSGDITDKKIGICHTAGSPGEAKVLHSCTVGRPCKVTGTMNDCEGADYCVEFLKITGARTLVGLLN